MSWLFWASICDSVLFPLDATKTSFEAASIQDFLFFGGSNSANGTKAVSIGWRYIYNVINIQLALSTWLERQLSWVMHMFIVLLHIVIIIIMVILIITFLIGHLLSLLLLLLFTSVVIILTLLMLLLLCISIPWFELNICKDNKCNLI